MRSAIYTGPETIVVEERPVPKLNHSQALLRVRETGICGTDMQIFAGKHPRAMAPLIPGHEIFGTIEDVGPGVAKALVGDRVVIYPLITCGNCEPCRAGNPHVCEHLKLVGIDRDGGFAEFVAVDEQQLVSIPEEISDREAVIIEPLAVAVHAVCDSSFRVGDSVLITGGGPIGNLLAQVLRASAAREVVVSEVSAFRRGILSDMGFVTFDPSSCDALEVLEKSCGRRAVDIVFEATGQSSAYADALRCCSVRGHVSFVGIPKTPAVVDVQTIVYKEIHTSSARVYRQRDYASAIGLLASGAVRAETLITHRVSLASAADAYMLMKKADSSGKIVITPEASHAAG